MTVFMHRPGRPGTATGANGYDGIDSDVAAILAVAQPGDVVGGYFDGPYAWSAANWASVAAAKLLPLHISVLANPQADTFDCEPGNAGPVQVASAIAARLAQKLGSLEYCPLDSEGSTFTYSYCVAANQAAGVAVDQWDWWAPDYTGAPHLYPGSVGTQYEDAGPYDLSYFDPAWIQAWFAPYLPPDPPQPPQPANTLGVLLSMIPILNPGDNLQIPVGQCSSVGFFAVAGPNNPAKLTILDGSTVTPTIDTAQSATGGYVWQQPANRTLHTIQVINTGDMPVTVEYHLA